MRTGVDNGVSSQIIKKKMPIGPFEKEKIDEMNSEFLMEYYENNQYWIWFLNENTKCIERWV